MTQYFSLKEGGVARWDSVKTLMFSMFNGKCHCGFQTKESTSTSLQLFQIFTFSTRTLTLNFLFHFFFIFKRTFFFLILSNINIMWNGENEKNCDKTESHFIFEVRLCNYWNCKYWNWMFNECNQQSLSLWCFSLKLNVNVINKFYC